jgi:hypothetical protein
VARLDDCPYRDEHDCSTCEADEVEPSGPEAFVDVTLCGWCGGRLVAEFARQDEASGAS